VTTKSKFLDPACWRSRIFNGSWEHPTGGTTQVVEPATGEVLTVVGLANARDVAVAAEAAAAAQREWIKLPPRERADVFRRAATLLQENIEELGLWVARETGALVLKGQHEIREAVTLLNIAASKPLDPQGLVLPSTSGRLSYARRVPHGVVGVISPFNFPLILSLRAVAPALACGNGVVLKPDPQTPVSGGYIIARAFELAGLPKGLLQVLPGGADAGEALCTDANIGMIAFTGSTGVGRRVGELAGRHLKRVSLELGGKSSLIVLDDADLEIAASNVAWGAWLHQGQICMAAGRILVHEKVAPQLIRILAEKAKHLPVGDPAKEQVALGPIINGKQLQRVHGIVMDSVAAGATLEAGGSYENLFYRPTVLSGVKPGMRAFEEEIFGPIVNVTTFANDDEAVQLANQTAYGLAAGVISRSVGRAMALGERLNTGMLHINDQTVADDCVNPFGGRGCSGNGGNVGGPADIDEFTQWQWVTVQETPNRYPF
jgi:benzaldehyde dehydrogenase (NAD)